VKAKSSWKRGLREESGTVLVMSALLMTALLGFVALATDVGLLLHAKRDMQIAADAAAIAGALDYKYNGSTSSAKTAACAAAAANGVSGTCSTGSCSKVSAITICVNSPPLSGYHTSVGYTEAIVAEPAPTIFMRAFHINSVDVAGRAVAGSGLGNGCIWALSRSGTDVSLTGSGSITAQNCEIYDDSSSANAMTLTGSGAISAKEIGIVGGYNVTGSGRITPNPPTTGIAPAADPLTLTAPATGTGTCSSNCNPSNTGSGNITLQPGTYTSISNTGSGTVTLNPGNYTITGNLTNTGSGGLILGAGNYSIGGNFNSTGSSSITMGSGLYTIGGNLALTGSGSMTGSGVTFYTLGGDTLTGSGNMNLTAPTSGTYDGVLIYQPPSDTSTMSITGSGGDKIQGILYAPGAPLTLTGSGSLTVSLDIIVDTLKVTGSGSVTDTNYAAVTNTGSVLSKLVLAE